MDKKMQEIEKMERRTINDFLDKYNSRAKNERFMQAVDMIWKKAEKTLLEVGVKKLSEWAGKHIWYRGYKPKCVTFMAQFMDYNTKLGVGVNIKAEKSNTARQFCYQFVIFSQLLIDENDRLSEQIKYWESSKYIRLIKFSRDMMWRIRISFRRLILRQYEEEDEEYDEEDEEIIREKIKFVSR